MSPMVSHPLSMEHALLGFLSARPMHGYELFQTLNSPSGLGLVWRLKQSQLYALLAKLEERGFVQATVEPQENRPPRKMFDLTEDGRRALGVWIRTPVARPRELRLEFLAKLYFARLEGPETTRQLTTRQISRCRSWLAEYESRLRDLNQVQSYERLVWDLRTRKIEAMLEWLVACKEHQ